ncbi:MAG: site-2 protease family protein [Candidatus Nomurabacteria bacterium]
MTFIIFIIILLVLVLIHEAGHFFAAKISGVKVDEFAFGFPPKIYSVKKGETNYVFNALPLGGYVKIFGENGEDKDKKVKKDERSFFNKKPLTKIFILSAGVLMNLILAYILVTASFYIGTTFQIDKNTQEYKKFSDEGRIRNEFAVINYIANNSPAKRAGLKPGLKIEYIYINEESSNGTVYSKRSLDLNKEGDQISQDIFDSINTGNADSITIVYDIKNEKTSSTTLAGIYGIDGDYKNKKTGISITKFATITLPISDTFILGFQNTNQIIKETVLGFGILFKDLFKHGQVSKDVSGPVGIFNMISQASQFGISYIFLFAAILSVSLAIFNILPFPALDGGRILFVIIESITKKKISEKWQTILNGIGFVILILLMIIVSFRDIMSLFK